MIKYIIVSLFLFACFTCFGQSENLNSFVTCDLDSVDIAKCISQDVRTSDIRGLELLQSDDKPIDLNGLGLEKLLILYVDAPKLKKTPAGIERLTELTELELQIECDNCEIDLSNFKWLRFLLFNGQRLPVGILTAPQMESVTLVYSNPTSNDIVNLEQESSIKSLSLKCASLESIPEDVYSLFNLEELVVSSDSELQLSSRLSEMASLDFLSIRCHFFSNRKFIYRTPYLKYLVITDERFKFRRDISSLEHLEHLKIFSQELSVKKQKRLKRLIPNVEVQLNDETLE